MSNGKGTITKEVVRKEIYPCIQVRKDNFVEIVKFTNGDVVIDPHKITVFWYNDKGRDACIEVCYGDVLYHDDKGQLQRYIEGEHGFSVDISLDGDKDVEIESLKLEVDMYRSALDALNEKYDERGKKITDLEWEIKGNEIRTCGLPHSPRNVIIKLYDNEIYKAFWREKTGEWVATFGTASPEEVVWWMEMPKEKKAK